MKTKLLLGRIGIVILFVVPLDVLGVSMGRSPADR